MSSALTERQKVELHKSLIQYLIPLLSTESASTVSTGEKHRLQTTLFKVLDVDEAEYNATTSKSIPENYLVKKWTAVLRLQKKILELENSVQQYQELTSFQAGSNSKTAANAAPDQWVPSKVKKTLKNHANSSVTSCSLHPFEPLLLVGTSDGAIVIWDLTSLVEPVKVIKNAHTKTVNCVRFSPGPIAVADGAPRQVLLLSCSSDLVIKVWDLQFQAIRSLTGHDHLVSAVEFHPGKERHLVSCSRDKTIKIWDIVSGWCLKTFVGHSDWVRKVDLNGDGEYVLSCSNDQSVRLSHLESGTGIGLMIGHGQVVESCKFFDNRSSNRYLDKLCVKYLYQGNEQDFGNLLPHAVYDQVGFKYCVTCGRDDTIKLWLLPVPLLRPHRLPLPSLNPQGTLLLTLTHHSSWVRDLQIHPNGRYLFSCSDDKTIKIWDLADDCKCVETLSKHESFVNCISFAAPIVDDEEEGGAVGYRNYFVSGGVDKTVVWA